MTPWTVACQAPLSMGFSRQEYWSGLPFPSPGDLPDLVIELVSPALASGFFTVEPRGKSWVVIAVNKYESFHFIFSFLRSSVSNMYNICSVFYSIRQYWCTWWHTDDSLCKHLTYTYSSHKHSIVGVFSHPFDFLYNIFFCLACSIIRI